MTISKALLLIASALGLIWKIRNVFQENRAKAHARLRDSAKRRWGIKNDGLFDDADEDSDDEFWE